MDLLPGLLQGITRVTISYPFDVIKVYSQNNGLSSIYNFKNNIKNNKTSFFRGIKLAYFFIPIERSIQLKYYEKLNKKFNPFISAFLINIPLSLITIPSNCLLHNLVLEKSNVSIIDFTKKFINKNGIKSLYKGMHFEYLRHISASTIYLGIYGNMRSKNDTVLNIVFNTLISSYTSWFFSYPLDYCKTLCQTNLNWKETLKNRIKQKSILCLWNGILPVLLRTMPSSISGMLIYEWTRNIIEKDNLKFF